MFEIGWTEMLVIAIVMIVVVGPKDLPKMLRAFGKTTARFRSMAGDFQRQFNEALKEAELDDVKQTIDSVRGLNPAQQIRKHLSPMEQAAADVRSGLDKALKPSTSSEPASPVVHPAEPLKAGPEAMPGGDPAPVAATQSPASAQVDPPAPQADVPPSAASEPIQSVPSKPIPAPTHGVNGAKPNGTTH